MQKEELSRVATPAAARSSGRRRLINARKPNVASHIPAALTLFNRTASTGESLKAHMQSQTPLSPRRWLLSKSYENTR